MSAVRRRAGRALAALFPLLAAIGSVAAWQASPGEVREAIREHFGNRLRQALVLDDEQFRTILPIVEEIERVRQQARRERFEIARELRRGLQDGASDGELRRLLDDLDAVDARQRRTERDGMRRIDEVLSVRQRVQFRFFIEEFRRDLRQRVEELRGGERRVPGPRRGVGRR